MAKEQGYETAKKEKEEFRDKGGKAVGDKDSVVDGKLSRAAGTTQEARDGKPGEIRPRLQEAAEELDEAKPKG